MAFSAESNFNLHSYVAHHDGLFWVVWSSSRNGEEHPDQTIRYATSRNGAEWSAPLILAADPDGPDKPARWIARGVFVEEGRLRADYSRRGQGEVWKNLRLVRFEWAGMQWAERGTYASNCMNYFPLSANPPFHRMDEPTLYETADDFTHMILRDNNRSGRLIHALSRDHGRTWSTPVLTDYPDATSKNFTGRLNSPTPSQFAEARRAAARSHQARVLSSTPMPSSTTARSGSPTPPTSRTLKSPACPSTSFGADNRINCPLAA